jgi:Ca2+-binding RTX toxin-like protein
VWTVTQGTTAAGVSNASVNQSLSVLDDALTYWARYIDFGAGTIDVTVNFISLGGTTLAQGGTSFIPTSGNRFQAITILELQTGVDQNGPISDIDIDINSDSLIANEFYFGGIDAPNVPGHLFDLFTVFIHEIGHGLGFISFSDQAEIAVFDDFVSGLPSSPVFTGPLAVAAYGGTIPLANDPSHILQSLNLLMSPASSAGERVDLTAAEFAILRDIGLPALLPTNGADVLFGFAAAETISLLGGDDQYDGLGGADNINGGSGDDTLRGGSGDDSLSGGNDADKLFGDGGRDTLRGEGGADQLFGGGGADKLFGGGGNDKLFGNANADLLDGGAGNDAFRGFGGNDRLLGGDGADSLLGHTGNDIINGGNNGDILDAGDGADQLFGDGGNDTLFGRDGNDTLKGGGGADEIFAGKGSDRIISGSGDDVLAGNGGNDFFIFTPGDDDDVITDFVAGAGTQDVIDLSVMGASFDTFAEVFAAASDDGFGNTVIDFGGGDTITLLGVAVADLHQDDFLFT